MPSASTLDPAALPDTVQFMRLLWSLVLGLEKASRRMSAELGVTGPQRLVLRIIGASPGLSAEQLAELLHSTPNAMGGVLQRLTDAGLLERVRFAGDARRVTLRLTRRGRQVNDTVHGTVEAIVAEALKSVTAAERKTTTRVIDRVWRQLDSAL